MVVMISGNPKMQVMLTFLFQNCGWHTCQRKLLPSFSFAFASNLLLLFFCFKICIQALFLSFNLCFSKPFHSFLDVWQVQEFFLAYLFWVMVIINSAAWCVNVLFIAQCLHGYCMRSVYIISVHHTTFTVTMFPPKS